MASPAEPAPPGVSLTAAEARTVHETVARGLPDAELWVFGSRATVRARPFSDLDLLLTRPAEIDWPQRAALRDAFESSDLPFVVDVVATADRSGAIADRVHAERRPLAALPPAS